MQGYFCTLNWVKNASYNYKEYLPARVLIYLQIRRVFLFLILCLEFLVIHLLKKEGILSTRLYVEYKKKINVFLNLMW